MEKFDKNSQIVVSLEKVEKPYHASFNTGIFKQPYFSRSWHYHPEYELLLITEGSGKRLVGDHAEDFQKNDLILLGSLLPHAWISDLKYLEKNSNNYCESIYVQFKKEIFGSYFIDIPELKGVRKVLRLSDRGIKIEGENKEEIIKLFKEFPNISPLDQLLRLLKILSLISLTEYELLTSESYLNNNFYFKSNRMIKIHQFIMENFQKDITIQKCAELSNMTKSSFCRFFKNETKYTFSNYLNKIRIDFSKKLLLNTNLAIKEIGYECGYNSVSYFNKQFKKVVGKPPYSFKKQ